LLKKLPTKKQTEADKKALLSYLANEYRIAIFNKPFVFKLEHIHEGSLKIQFAPIPYSTLLDMFKHYKRDLEKQSIYNKATGKKFSDQHGVLNYDLAIILNKHSDYMNFLQEDKVNSNTGAVAQETVNAAVQRAVHKAEETDEIDINNMLEDW
jgi:hypothetical protein